MGPINCHAKPQKSSTAFTPTNFSPRVIPTPLASITSLPPLYKQQQHLYSICFISIRTKTKLYTKMLKIETSTGNNDWARTCDICRAAASAVYCRADAAYLCMGCDSDIHSANPLARRHHRVPVLPVPGYGTDDFLNPGASENVNDDDEEEVASWLLLNPVKNGQSNDGNNNEMLFGGDMDEHLDLDDYSSCHNTQFSDQQHYSVPQKGKNQIQQQFYQLGLDDYEPSNTGYNYPASMSHSVSFSSMEVGVVPESTMSEVSVSHQRPPKGTIDLFAGSIQMPTQLSPIDREARVLRYREKKKMRKFEKTIRYASRKAYAETRPRVKGRFAKRTDREESEVNQMFSMSESAYGVVPSF